MMIMNNSNALIQSHVPDNLRGRVMSVYALVFFGSMPGLATLLRPGLSPRIRVEPLTVMLGAGVLMVLGYGTLDILPEIRRQERRSK